MSVRDMKKMLGRLRALGAPMQILSVDEKEDGHAHVVFHNNDTYKGVWKDSKMNGFGTFRKNEVVKNQYDWQFCGQFKNDCAITGQLRKIDDPTDGESRPSGSGGKPVYEWDPFPPPGERVVRQQDGPVGREQATGGLIKADQQIQEMNRRLAEKKKNNNAKAKEDADEYNSAADTRMMASNDYVDRYGRKPVPVNSKPETRHSQATASPSTGRAPDNSCSV